MSIGKNNIKIYLMWNWWAWTGFIWLRIRKKWAAPVNTAINIRASENVKNFLTGFTRRTVFYRVGYCVLQSWLLCSTELVTVFYRVGYCVLQRWLLCSTELVTVFYRVGYCVLQRWLLHYWTIRSVKITLCAFSQKFWFICNYGTVLCLTTALKVGRSRVRFPIMSLKIFFDIMLPAALWP
jgi:hypothetical protein